jgi:hypothetical protein
MSIAGLASASAVAILVALSVLPSAGLAQPVNAAPTREETAVDLQSIQSIRDQIQRQLQYAGEIIELRGNKWYVKQTVGDWAWNLARCLRSSGRTPGGWNHLERYRTQRLIIADLLGFVLTASSTDEHLVWLIAFSREDITRVLGDLERELESPGNDPRMPSPSHPRAARVAPTLAETETDLRSVRAIRDQVREQSRNESDLVGKNGQFWQMTAANRRFASTLSRNLTFSGEVHGGWQHLARYCRERLQMASTLERCHFTPFVRKEDGVRSITSIYDEVIDALNRLERTMTARRTALTGEPEVARVSLLGSASE